MIEGGGVVILNIKNNKNIYCLLENKFASKSKDDDMHRCSNEL
jgi:hypothetical protein